jgi:hypothetical protein
MTEKTRHQAKVLTVSDSVEATPDGTAFELGIARFAGERVHLVLGGGGNG